jgi:hypothetical protein
MHDIASRPLIEQAIRRTTDHIAELKAHRRSPVATPYARGVLKGDLLEIERTVLSRLQELFTATRKNSP